MNPLHDQQIGIIGAGNMGSAIIQAVLQRGDLLPENITASDPSPQQRESIRKQFRIQVTDDNRRAVQGAEIIILSVKPQILNQVMHDLQGEIPDQALVFSIVAGRSISSLQQGLKHRAVIRAMPNTPAQIGEGMTVWTDSAQVTDPQRDQGRSLLAALGKELHVEHEDTINMATAVSGTGPTYIFLLIEALVDAAVHLGFSRRDARYIVLQTVLGSVKFAQGSDLHLAQLRNMVTSPGGTSAEAIYQLEKGGMRTILSKAVWSAYQKSRLLGKESGDPIEAPLDLEGE